MRHLLASPAVTPARLVVAGALCLLAAPAAAQQVQLSGGMVKIGVLTDLSGIYADLAGSGSVIAAKMAVEDFGGAMGGRPVEVVSADTLNKPDTAANRAREWFDRDGVDYIVDLPASSVALSVIQVAKSKGRAVAIVGAAATRVTNEDCGPYVFHWAYDTYALATTTAKSVLAAGGDSWYFITADYAGGHALAKDASDIVRAGGGKVLGEVRHPFPGTDFSSFLVKAAASEAKVIGLANAGNDAVNAIRQAAEFGIGKSKVLAATLLFDTDVHAIGLKRAQGMYLATGFYWDYDEQTRAFGKRFFDKQKRMPTMVQAGVYSATLHYLRAVKAAGTDDTAAVAAMMKKMPVQDFFARNGVLREDGRMVHDMYLARVKKPGDSKYPWDYFAIERVIRGEDAFLPLSNSTCALVKR